MRSLFRLFVPLTLLLVVSLSLLLLEERKVFDIRTLTQIDPIPHVEKLIIQNKYVDAYEELTYFMQFAYVNKNPKSHKLLRIIETKRETYAYRTEKILEGLIEGGSDEDIGKASAIASDFLVIGDIRDLSIEGLHYLKNEKVNSVMVALSSLGLIATASTVYSLGATSPIKTSISVLKYGKRVKKLPLWLNKELIAQAKIAKELKSVQNIRNLLEPIYTLYNKVGLNQTLNLLKITKSSREFKNLLKFSTRFGKNSNILLKTTNNQALHYSKQLPNVSSKNFLYASSYGENGLKGLKKMGEGKFLKRVGFYSNLAKTSYKGNLNSLWNYLLKVIPSSVLFGLVFSGLFYFIWKFFSLAKELF